MTRARTFSGTRRVRPGASDGFTLAEMLVSMSIMLVVTSAVFTLVNPSQGAFRAQPEVSDMQQRMRVAADVLFKDLVMAGAGTYQGAAAGALVNFFPPIVPYRTGAQSADAALSFFADRLSLVFVASSASQTLIRDAMPQPSSEIKVNPQPGCPQNDPLCGFTVGMRTVIFDNTGAFDIFTVTHVQSSAQQLQHGPPNPNFSKAYTPNDQTRIAELVSRTYYLDSTTRQLRQYDGYQTDVPLVDHVVGLRFRYFGDPNPPRAPQPLPGTANCLFDASGNTVLPTLTATSGSLVELTAAMLTDGPVCGAAPNTFDADLYRVRKVRVMLRVQVAAAELRGTDTRLFNKPGSARGGERFVPDYEMSFEISPRNMNLTR